MIEDITKLYETKREELVRAYKSRAGANDVEDLIQEGFYRAILYKDSYRPALVSLEFWLVGILNNCLRDLLREKQGRGSLHQPLQEEDLVYELQDTDVLKPVILKLLGTKSGDAKQICYLYFIMQYPLKDIAKIIGCSYSNVDNVVERFKVKIREVVAKDDSI